MIDREEKLYKMDVKARFDYEQKENENRKEIRKILEEEFEKNNMKVLEVTRDVNDYEELKYYKNAFSKVTRALDIITKRRPMPYIHNYVSFAESVMAGKRAREMDEEAQRKFDEANKKGEDIWL